MPEVEILGGALVFLLDRCLCLELRQEAAKVSLTVEPKKRVEVEREDKVVNGNGRVVEVRVER